MHSRQDIANAIRILSIDAIQKAQSGHPGAPMGMADIAEVLWRDYLKHNPVNPKWPDRDRFVLSNGHSSMLLYSLLHLTGYNLSIGDLQNFRQWHSHTPGHPEYGYTDGIETTTGPLGQGIANAVGFAIAERTLAAQFNRPGYDIVNHYTYAFVGDGCMMEGISHEVCSLAGTLNLHKLIVFYDYNGISIDGEMKGWFTEDTAKRFESYGWHVVNNINGHEVFSIKNAIEEARRNIDKPSLLICKTVIGFGSPNKSGTHDSHGSPLGEEEIILTRKELNWKYPPFFIPEEIYEKWNAKKRGQQQESQWDKKILDYERKYPKLAKEFKRRINSQLPNNWHKISESIINKLHEKPANIATRKASQNIIEAFGPILPEYLGGSADLAPSNLTMWSGSKPINLDKSGNYIHYGVREFGMTAIANGIALHTGFLPYTATFLVFSEYARNAVRMAALMKIRHIMIYTHDSIGLGEDGPTHQPVEQLANLRHTPNMSTWRPCDQVESAVAWKFAIERLDGPTSLILSRQNLIQQKRNSSQISNISRGGYILKDCDGKPKLILIATGSEVSLAVSVWQKLYQENYKVRVVSLPSTDVFDKQDEIYRESVLPSSVVSRIAIEASSSDYWFKYTGLHGAIIGMTSFGESAPSDKLFEKFGFTVNHIINIAKSFL
ncbi:transketolase [Candidatus Ishikawella capsulata]|uniref:Transketolase n=1 Tax=Candidatus Ishikawaella capsulata Mpkobe TaxID=476281 RepID=C5WCF9_9ENTR|nr:transketolase [Candidatus Ishikawaella capsulata]BAH83015.1 transketolase [Candidatus Ishikawaella capsulata Mpkobe]